VLDIPQDFATDVPMVFGRKIPRLKAQVCNLTQKLVTFSFQIVLSFLIERISFLIFTVCSTLLLDLIFLLDGSFSVGFSNFKKVKQWTKDVAANFELSSGNVQLGVIEYGTYYFSQ